MGAERVQMLSCRGISELPAQFIRAPHEQPKNSRALEGLKVPVISLSQPHDQLVLEVSKASKEWGFFAIKDHDVPSWLIHRVQEVGQEFFAQPPEEKEKYANDLSKGKYEGYGTKLAKNSDEKKIEWIDYFFHIMSPPSRVNYEIWPQNPPNYREVTDEYNRELLRIAHEILALLSEGLGLGKNVLKTHLGDGQLELEMKINMYPPCPQPELVLGVEPHTDMSALTILLPNDVPGLQVWKDGNWITVDYIPGAFYIHIGDQVEILSNGKYKSILHRSLVDKEKTRMSWAVFCVPPGEMVIGPLGELVDDQNPEKYSTKTYAQYRYHKLNRLPQ